jgi:predicted enzyme involved in methoxymalonyl-ACP biosynthesis
LKDFKEIKRNLKKDFTNFSEQRIAILGDTSTQFLSQTIRALGYDKEYDLKIWEADYNQIELQIIDENSALYKFKPNVVLIFFSTHKLLGKFNKIKNSQLDFATNELENYSNLITILNSRISTKIILYNFPEIDDVIYGNFANKVEN